MVPKQTEGIYQSFWSVTCVNSSKEDLKFEKHWYRREILPCVFPEILNIFDIDDFVTCFLVSQ